MIKKTLYTDPQLFRKCKCLTVTMATNSLHPTILCVITLCVFLSSIYNQDAPFLGIVELFVVVVVAVIVLRNHLLGMDWSVVMPMAIKICLLARGASVGGVFFVQLSLLILRDCHRSHSSGQ